MGLEDDEGESGTIYNANIGIGRKIKCKGTIDVISTGATTKGTKAKVKRKHDTRFPKGEEHLQMDGDIYEN
jgi:hypothetical protein